MGVQQMRVCLDMLVFLRRLRRLQSQGRPVPEHHVQPYSRCAGPPSWRKMEVTICNQTCTGFQKTFTCVATSERMARTFVATIEVIPTSIKSVSGQLNE